MGTLFATIAFLLGLMATGILVDRLYRRFAARNPQLGPFRRSDKCGCCSQGSACRDENGCN
ncbi:MAG: hypothetical protein JNM82_08060 [Rhodocyclaceae bacterium]|nr:hypothetical protein [Rhodocyclaceae bacterium]